MRPRFEVFSGGAGWYWRLLAGNGETVAQSESYTRKADAERGAKDARRAARFAQITEEVNDV